MLYTQKLYINCGNYRLALYFKHIRHEFPWLETSHFLSLGQWKAFPFSTKNRYILNEIQTAYSVKSHNVIKATVMHWLSHGAACKRTQERYPIIIESLDDIIAKDPKAKLIGLHDQMLNSETLLQICFLEDVLSITNILSLVLKSDKKDFATVCRAMQLTCLQLNQMRDNFESSLLKSFNTIQFQNVVEHSGKKQ